LVEVCDVDPKYLVRFWSQLFLWFKWLLFLSA